MPRYRVLRRNFYRILSPRATRAIARENYAPARATRFRKVDRACRREGDRARSVTSFASPGRKAGYERGRDSQRTDLNVTRCPPRLCAKQPDNDLSVIPRD